MGRWHIEGYQGHPACRVVAIADPNAARLAEIGDKFNVPRRYESVGEMLGKEKLDVVSVATPNKYHKPLTIAALKAGAHVLCEKPMAMNAREAREMLAAAKACGRRLMINFSYRFNEQSQALKREVESGVLGKVYFARTVWHRSRGIPGFGGWFGRKTLSGGGPLIDLGVHRLDLALWLMGYPKPAWVLANAYHYLGSSMARKAKKSFDVEDMAVGFIKFADGSALEIEASWASNRPEAEFMETRLFGTKGGLLQHNVDEGYKFEAELHLEKGGKVVRKTPRKAKATSAMYHFVDSIINRRPHSATGEEGATVMRLLDAIYASAKKGKPVRTA